MEDKVCLDTDFLVNFLRNKSEAIEFIQANEKKKELATTCINLFELYYGAFKSDKKHENLEIVASLLNRMQILNFSHESVKKAGEILAELDKKGSPIEFRDLFIGSIALVNGYSIRTDNIKHFSKIKGLEISE